MRNPVVDLEHGRSGVGRTPVGYAHTGLCKADGFYTGRHVNLECDDGKTRPLPVGTTHFDPSDKFQYQIFAMVERDILPAVSLEFEPVVKKAIGWSEMEKREAYDFAVIDVRVWSVCEKGVCPSALVAKSAYDPLASVLSAGRLGGEPLCDTVKKAFARRAPGKPSAVTSGFAAPVVEKSDMDPYGSAPVDPPVDAAPPPPEDDSSGATPTAQAGYDGAQMLTDACAHIREKLKGSEHKAGKNKLGKLCDKVEALVEQFMATGDMVAEDVGSDEDMSEDDEEPEVEEGDTEPDEDGVMKGMKKPKRVRYMKALQRFTAAQIAKAEQAMRVTEQPAPPAAGDTPEDEAYLEKQLRLYERDKRRYG
jgi:hypothetical protein